MKKLGAYEIVAAALIVLATALFANLFLKFGASTEVMARASSFEPKIIIDAGHGGFDPGAIAADKTPEKDINLAISLKLADLFRAFGYEVILTRDIDAGTEDSGLTSVASRKTSDIHNRVKLANETENCVYISIHQNAYQDRSQDGVQLLYGVKNERSKLLADCIFESVKKNIQPDNRREVKR